MDIGYVQKYRYMQKKFYKARKLFEFRLKSTYLQLYARTTDKVGTKLGL